MKISLEDKQNQDQLKDNLAKPILDENADIYRNREQKTAKETFKTLKGKAKARYFVDYYLGKIIIVVVILALLGSIIYTALKPKPEQALYMAIVVSPFTGSGLEKFTDDLEEMFIADPDKEQIIMDTNFSSLVADYNSSMSYMMHMSAGEIDMVILTKDELKYQVNNEALIPVDKAVSKEILDKIPDSAKHKVVPTYPQENGDFIEGKEEVYGLNIESFLERINGFETTNKYVVAFTSISKHSDKFDRIVKYMFDIK